MKLKGRKIVIGDVVRIKASKGSWHDKNNQIGVIHGYSNMILVMVFIWKMVMR